jgi:hypothetical protein
MAVAAMGSGEIVVGAECGDDSDGDGFLADAEVRGAGHFALEEEDAQALLETADEEHVAVEFFETCVVEVHVSPRFFGE